VLVLLGVCVGNARADTTFTASCDACVAQYSGTFTELYTEPISAGSKYTDTTKVNISWSQNVVYDGNQASTAQPLSAHGTYDVTTDAPGGQGSSCVAQVYQNTASTIGWTPVYAYDANGKHITGYSVIAGSPALQLTGDEDCSRYYTGYTAYNISAWTGSGCHWDTHTGIVTTIPPGGPYTQTDNCVYDNTDQQGDSTDDTATDSLTWHSAGSSTGTGPTVTPAKLGPDYPASKNQAHGDLIRAIRSIPVPCAAFAAAGNLLGTGILLAGSPGGVGVTLAVTGGLVAPALAPLCTPVISRIVVDYKNYEDPPLDSIDVIARPAAVKPPRLPACHRDVRYCTALRTALGSLDTATLDASADAKALEQTVSREHAAALEGNQAAVDAQDRDLGRLEPAFARSQRAEASAERAVAGVLRGAHIEFRLTKAQSRELLGRVRRAIAHAGVPPSQITAVDRRAFKPAATNLLSVLG
jgi:hypothetical protein